MYVFQDFKDKKNFSKLRVTLSLFIILLLNCFSQKYYSKGVFPCVFGVNWPNLFLMAFVCLMEASVINSIFCMYHVVSNLIFKKIELIKIIKFRYFDFINNSIA